MTMISSRACLTSACALVLALAAALPPSAAAHGVGSRWLEGGPAPRAVLFHYSTGEPMAYAKVKVFGPRDDKMEYQSARTDRAGVFAFLPDGPGPWRVEASDDEGHKAVAEVSVPDAAAPSGTSSENVSLPKSAPQAIEPRPVWESALLGASLTLNLFTGAALWRGRTRSA